MAASFWTSLGQRLGAGPGSFWARPDSDGPTADGATDGDPGPTSARLAGQPQVLDRPVEVRPDTMVVVFDDEEPPRLVEPGEHVRPRVRLTGKATQVLVVNTAPVDLDVTIDELRTQDGMIIVDTVIRVTVQLAAAEHAGWVLELATDLGPGLEDHLLDRVREEVAAGATAAARLNPLADLRRLTFDELLAQRWLPRVFAGGVLVRRDLRVLTVGWPDEPGVDRPRSGRGRSRPDDDEFSLTLDPDLARLWQAHAEPELHGIAGAQVLGDTAVVAVCSGRPGAYESSRLQEAFNHYFDSTSVKVITSSAQSYEELVGAWFRQVDDSLGPPVSVEADGHEVLRITLHPTLTSTGETRPDLVVGSPADRKALRRLVPHGRIQFVSADVDR